MNNGDLIPTNTGASQSSTLIPAESSKVRNYIIALSVSSAVIGCIAFLLVALSSTGETRGWMLFAAFGGAIIAFPIVGFVLGTGIFLVCQGIQNKLYPLIIGILILLGLYTWIGISFHQSEKQSQQRNQQQNAILQQEFQLNQNASADYQRLSNAATRTADCESVVSSSFWAGCVLRTLQTAEDYRSCMAQSASASQQNGPGWCTFLYAWRSKQPTLCIQLTDIHERQYCQEQYDKVHSPQ